MELYFNFKTARTIAGKRLELRNGKETRPLNPLIKDIAGKLLSEDTPPALLEAYREALESHNAPIVVIDVNGTVRYLNKSACDMARISSAEKALGKQVGDVGFAWYTDGKSLADRLAHGEPTTYFEVDENSYACEAVVLLDKLNREKGVLEYVHTDGDWVYDTGIDPLTGIANKAHFLANTRRLLDCNPDTHYVIVQQELLRFKLINDVFSAATGKMVLKNTANAISSFVGNEGTCGHLGNGRFVFCAPRARLNGNWFKKHSEVTLLSDTAMYTFNSTYGVYEIDDRSCSVETMCERAAFAQSTVKETHADKGDCYALYDDAMHESVSEDQELLAQLSYALESNQIKVHFQPIYDINTGQVASAEALARWEHPEKGLIYPGRFIPLFEINGMITQLDKYLWDQVGDFLEKRSASGKRVVPISVNVSRVDFFATSLIDDIDEIVDTHNLPRSLLRLEITESAYIDDPMRISDAIEKLSERGHTILLDDFGSGYSSLTTLKDLPVDILKLDMSFLRDFDTDKRTKYIINHIIAMAHDLDHKVVTEGVETQEQVNFLREANCHLAQGFFYARPLPEASFVKVLDEATPLGL